MKVFEGVFICYFVIGCILGFIAVSKYSKAFGDSPFAIIMFLCCLAGWPIAFPDMMADLKEKKNQDERKNNNQSI